MKKWIFAILIINSITVNGQYRIKSNFHPEWVVGANVGLNAFVSEGIKEYLSQPLTAVGFTGNAIVGYNFTRTIGVRGSIGIVNHNWPDVRGSIDHSTNLYQVISFNAENINVDMLVNLNSVLSINSVRSPLKVGIFGGLGLVHRDQAKFSTELIAMDLRLGLQGDYNIMQNIDLNVITELNVVDDKYNEYATPDGFLYDLYPTLKVGVTYHIKPSKSAIRHRSPSKGLRGKQNYSRFK